MKLTVKPEDGAMRVEVGARHPLDPGPEVRAVWTEDSDFRRASAHFPGHTHVDVERWGELVIERFGGTPYAKDWLEWGCGGGTVALAVRKKYAPYNYYAVDISQDSLDECMRRTKEMVIALLANESGTIADGAINYLLSIACFQHFPSFDYARAVLREMRRVAAPSARGMIHARYFTPGDHYDPTALQPLGYRKTWQRFCAWQVPDFWRELEQAGFAPTDVVLEPETQHAWYRFGVK